MKLLCNVESKCERRGGGGIEPTSPDTLKFNNHLWHSECAQPPVFKRCLDDIWILTNNLELKNWKSLLNHLPLFLSLLFESESELTSLVWVPESCAY